MEVQALNVLAEPSPESTFMLLSCLLNHPQPPTCTRDWLNLDKLFGKILFPSLSTQEI